MAKQFSDKEKQILIGIYNRKDSHTYALTNVFEQWLFRPGIRLDLRTGYLTYDQDIYGNLDDYLAIRKEIITIALLIKYLEDQGCIYIIQDPNSQPLPYIGEDNIAHPIDVALPKDITQIIKRSQYNIVVSYDFVQFVENDFKTYEDLQLIQASKNLEASNKQIRISRGSLIVSTLTLLCTLFMTQCSNCSQNKHDEAMLNALMELEANYYSTTNQNTLELCAHIDSLGVTMQHIKQPAKDVQKCHKVIKKQYNYLRIDTMSCDGVKYIVLPLNNQSGN